MIITLWVEVRKVINLRNQQREWHEVNMQLKGKNETLYYELKDVKHVYTRQRKRFEYRKLN